MFITDAPVPRTAEKERLNVTGVSYCCRAAWLAGLSGYKKKELQDYILGQIKNLHDNHYACIMALTKPGQDSAVEVFTELGFENPGHEFKTYKVAYGQPLMLWWYDLSKGLPQPKENVND